MNLKLETEYSKADIFKEIDDLKKQVDALRPLPPDVEDRVMQKLRLDWNYNSNAIEGNRLSYGETVAFLMEGITAKGKPLKDHLDIRGHNDAINFLLELVKDARPISESDIRDLHKMTLVEPYNVPAQTPTGVATTKRINLGEYKTSLVKTIVNQSFTNDENLLVNIKDYLSQSHEVYTHILMGTEHREFKNSDKSFSINTVLYVSFDEYNYEIFNDDNTIVSKLYHEELTKKDIQNIVKSIISSFKKELQKSLSLKD